MKKFDPCLFEINNITSNSCIDVTSGRKKGEKSMWKQILSLQIFQQFSVTFPRFTYQTSIL